MAFLRNFTSGWPQLIPAYPINELHSESGLGFFPPNLVATGHFWGIWPLVDPGWPQHNLWPRNELHFDQGFFLPNLMAIRHFSAIWNLVDPGWPLHDLWPQQCITLWSGVLLTKFGGHRALLGKLTPTWPQLTSSWPSTPAMHYTLIRGSSQQIWWV